MRLAVVGATGKMGRAVLRLAEETGHKVVCAVSPELMGTDIGVLLGTDNTGILVTDDLLSISHARPEVVIDFSSANATVAVAEASSRAGAALVCGTTGLTEPGLEAISLAAQAIAVLWEPNMSVGVHVLKDLVRHALIALGDNVDVEITETHHRFKADSPSGTALALLEVAKQERDVVSVTHGRSGRPGARGYSEIGMHAIRGGDVIGDHSVHFLCEGERIELVHRATSRDLFAQGALRAAVWMAGKPRGRYTMQHVLAIDN
jgi:4-hydroxy-tetrahydrodipicolinate reductase